MTRIFDFPYIFFNISETKHLIIIKKKNCVSHNELFHLMPHDDMTQLSQVFFLFLVSQPSIFRICLVTLTPVIGSPTISIPIYPISTYLMR